MATALVAVIGLTVFVRLASSKIDVAGVQAGGTCGLSQPAFCDTFDQPAGTGNRSGQLNGTVWGVSHATGNMNLGGLYNAWTPTQLTTCAGTTNVQPANDIVICNGQVREATNDGQTVTTLSMYVKQPFDFAGRTGIATFDVSNDTQGSHAAWPEFWMTDQPVPTPFQHEASWIAAARNGFGVRFSASSSAGHGALLAPACPNDANIRFTVDSAVVDRNYVADDSFNGGAIRVTPLDCVIASSGPNGGLNHVEIHVAQNQIDVYATDAGTTAPLHHIAVIQNANLTFSRGLVWIEDVHYNGSKFNSQGTHTFAWDNVGFDGPVLPRDLTFVVPDALTPAGGGVVNLGWFEDTNAPQSKTIAGVSNVSGAVAGLLTFSSFQTTAPNAFTYVVNGHSHSWPWPYPDRVGSTWRTLAVPVPLSDVLTGANTISIASDQAMVIANVDLVLAGAGGGGTTPPPPTPTPTAVPVNTPMPTKTAVSGVPTSTPVPTSTCAVVGKLNGVDTAFTRPMAFCTNQ